MTAEIVDLDKYRERKNRLSKQTPSAQPETANELNADGPFLARLEELRNKDSGDPACPAFPSRRVIAEI